MSAALAVVRFDLALVRAYGKQLVIFLLFMAVLATLNGPLAALPIFTVISTVVASYPFSIGERDRTDQVLAAAPVSRTSIVIGRYFSSFVEFITLLVIGIIVVFALQTTEGKEPSSGGEVVATVLACLVLYCLTIAVQLPLYFRYGYAKARLIALLPFAVIGAIVAFLYAQHASASSLEAFATLFTPLGAGVTVCVAVGLLALSLILTTRAYQRKDL